MNAREKLLEKLLENGIDEDIMLADGFFDSLIGVTMFPNLRAVYSYDKMLEEYMEKNSATFDEAADFINDVVRWAGYMGDKAPIIVDSLE